MIVGVAVGVRVGVSVGVAVFGGVGEANGCADLIRRTGGEDRGD